MHAINFARQKLFTLFERGYQKIRIAKVLEYLICLFLTKYFDN